MSVLLPMFKPKDPMALRWVNAVARSLRSSRRVTYRHKGTGTHTIALPSFVSQLPAEVRVIRIREVGATDGQFAGGSYIEWTYRGDALDVTSVDKLNASLEYDITLEIVTE